MKGKIYRLLNIKESEAGPVFDLLSVQFCMGLAHALVNIIAFTLFIYNFQIRYLPDVYLVVAVGLIVINIIYEKLEHRFPAFLLLKHIIAFSAVLLLLLWVGLAYGDHNIFIFTLISASVLLYMLNGYAFWGLVSMNFNVRESRRVFSIVGGGDIPAKLVGYIAGPLLIPVMGLDNLLWLAIGAMIVAWILMQRLRRKPLWKQWQVHAHHAGEDVHHEKQSWLKFLLEHKLILAISILSLLSYNVFVLVDFTFISQVKLKFDNITDLAFYIALFFAFGRLLAMAFKLIFTSRVIERLGVIYCLFITPLALFLFSVVFLIYGGHPDYNVFIFGLMAMLTEVLRSTMQEPVFFILFQPLRESLRLRGHIISKGYMYPPSLLIVGLSLLFIYETGIVVNILFVIKVLILNLCVWAAVIFYVRRTYFTTIQESIRKGTLINEDLLINDAQTIKLLVDKVHSGKSSEVIFALYHLEKSAYPQFESLLKEQLEPGKDVSLQLYSLNRLCEISVPDLTMLKSVYEQQEDPILRNRVFALRCQYDPGYLKQQSGMLNSTNPETKRIILEQLFREKSNEYGLLAANTIKQMATSAKVTDRELAAEVIGELSSENFSGTIETLINDTSLSVKRVALIAACKHKHEKLLPLVLQKLEMQEERNIVLKGLQLYGDELFEAINRLEFSYRQYDNELIRIAARMKGPLSTQFLLSQLRENDIILRQVKVVDALWSKGFVPVETPERRKMQDLLSAHLESGIEKVEDYARIPAGTDQHLIRRSVHNEVKISIATVLKICAMLYGRNNFNRVLELMDIDRQQKLFNGMEMIELLLPKRTAKDLNQLFDYMIDPDHSVLVQEAKSVQFASLLTLYHQPGKYHSWTRALSLFLSWKMQPSKVFTDLLFEPENVNDPLLRETYNFVAIQSR